MAESAKAVAEQCDITVAMLADPAAAEAVATGPDGIAAGMKAGHLPANCRLLPHDPDVIPALQGALSPVIVHQCLKLMQARGMWMYPQLMLEQLKESPRYTVLLPCHNEIDDMRLLAVWLSTTEKNPCT